MLVTGAAGLVGSHVCRQLSRRGWRVRALVRDAVRASSRLADTTAEIRSGDVRDVAALESAMRGAGSVVHLAAIAIERGNDTYESVNTEATHRVLDTMRRAGIRRLVFMSQNGASSAATSPFLRSKGVAEDMVRSGDLRWTVLRPSVIFGREDEFANVLARLVRITPFVLPLPDGGRARFQPVAVDDVARAVVTCLEREDTVRQTYAIGGPAVLTLRDMTERILLAMRARRHILAIPRGVLRPLLAIVQRVIPRPPVTTTLLDLLANDNIVENNALTRVFAITPTPFAPEELDYLRQITARDALRSMFRGR